MKTIELTDSEIFYLSLLIAADLKMRGDAVIHALSHGTNYEDPGMDTGTGILDKIGG